MQSGWIQRIVRIRPDYIRLCSFLEFISDKKGIDKPQFFNEVFLYSLNSITDKGFNYNIEEYKPRRKPKGFLMEQDTSDTIDTTYDFYSKIFQKKYNRILYIADFVELLLYIYAINNLTESELQALDLEWGIEKVE